METLYISLRYFQFCKSSLNGVLLYYVFSSFSFYFIIEYLAWGQCSLSQVQKHVFAGILKIVRACGL